MYQGNFPPPPPPPPPPPFPLTMHCRCTFSVLASTHGLNCDVSIPNSPCKSALQEFSTIWHSWLTMFNFMVSGFEFGIFYECHNPEAAIVLVVLYMFVVAVIFLNLLVGVMTDSWAKVSLPSTPRILALLSAPLLVKYIKHRPRGRPEPSKLSRHLLLFLCPFSGRAAYA